MIKKIFVLSLSTILVFGCQKENVSPTQSGVNTKNVNRSQTAGPDVNILKIHQMANAFVTLNSEILRLERELPTFDFGAFNSALQPVNTNAELDGVFNDFNISDRLQLKNSLVDYAVSSTDVKANFEVSNSDASDYRKVASILKGDIAAGIKIEIGAGTGGNHGNPNPPHPIQTCEDDCDDALIDDLVVCSLGFLAGPVGTFGVAVCGVVAARSHDRCNRSCSGHY
jgi:hypothetical protein